MTDEQKAKLKERREHPNCLWALWFDNEGCGPHPMGQGCDVYAQWYAYHIDESETVRHAVIAGSSLGGLFFQPDDARKLAARLIRAADLAEAAEVNDKQIAGEDVWDADPPPESEVT